ncbi:MAG: cytochrome c family protein [Pseudolabrys sp.]|jgi:hypothetical protein
MELLRNNLTKRGWAESILAVFLLLAPGMGTAAAIDAKLVIGPSKCAECHKKEAAIWQHTHHYTTFRNLPHDKDARPIAKKMGVRRMKSDSLCMNCHFTVQNQNGKLKAIAGISCESCHGAAKNWNKVHSNFSGKKEGQETKAEIAARWAKSEAAGMIRPKMIYRLAENCFNCHVVPNEKLVNIGGHKAGSDFELVSWSQGEVRHNVWYNKGKTNRKDKPARRRMMFVAGHIAELEASLIGVSKATVKADYAIKMAVRADRARKVMAVLAKLLPQVPELKEIAAVGQAAQLKLNNKAQLVAAADKVAQLGLKFSANYDGSKFGAIDKYIPGPDKYKGKVSQ